MDWFLGLFTQLGDYLLSAIADIYEIAREKGPLEALKVIGQVRTGIGVLVSVFVISLKPWKWIGKFVAWIWAYLRRYLDSPSQQGKSLSEHLRNLSRYSTIEVQGTDGRQVGIDLQKVYVPLSTRFSFTHKRSWWDYVLHFIRLSPSALKSKRTDSWANLAEDFSQLHNFNGLKRWWIRLQLRSRGFLLAGKQVSRADRNVAYRQVRRRLDVLEGVYNAEALEHIFTTEPLSLVIRQSRYILLEGEPGSGKTTTLKYLAWALRSASYSELSGIAKRDIQDMGLGLFTPYPIFVSLSDFAYYLELRQQVNHRTDDVDVFIDYLTAYSEDDAQFKYKHRSLGLFWAKDALRRGQTVLLLDGLDEVADSALRKDTAHIISLLVEDKNYRKSRVILSTRPSALSSTKAIFSKVKFAHAVVEKLHISEIRRFIRAYYEALSHHGQVNRWQEKAFHLVNTISENEQLKAQAETPVLLTGICVLHALQGGKLPERRAELYYHWIDILLKSRPDQQLSVDQRKKLFAELGYKTQCRGNEAKRVPIYELMDCLDALKVKGSKNLICDELLDKNGLFRQDGKAFVFRHQTFQEVLAALYIKDNPELEGELLGNLGETYWREVVRLFWGLHAMDVIRPQLKSKLNRFLEHIRSHLDLRQQPNAAMSMILSLNDLLLYDKDVDLHECSDFQGRMIQLVEYVRVLSDIAIQDQIAIGQLWDSIGDPRLVESHRWIKISAGRFWRGASPDDKDARDNEKPASWVMLSKDYWISRWPVTVSEYQKFIDEAGYKDKKFWSDEGWDWLGGKLDRKRYFTQELNNWPVTGVSWWEAEAYCRWLSVNPPKVGCTVRLPTEAEWERVARGADTQQIYPWGDTWDKNRALSVESGIRHPISVGLFEGGHSVEGAWDMSGNVWQWCLDGVAATGLSAYTSAEVSDPFTSLDSAPDRVVRGGSWFGGPHWLRVSYRDRGRYGPGLRIESRGFRVVCAQDT